jgi:DNA ligase-associated metallophosphoesterase
LQPPHSFKLHNASLWLSAQRCIFWEEEKCLIVSDLHFGKTGHFRKSGIAVPQKVFKEDLQRLVAQLQFFKPKSLLVVGDLFHSAENRELDLFRKWRDDLPDLQIKLVKGNHDILKESWYAAAGIEVYKDGYKINGFCFTHDNLDCFNGEPVAREDGKYTISGHIHPGVRISGLGKQSLCLPCFYFGKEFAVLPAFSRFTGTALIDPAAGAKVFALVNQELVELNLNLD